MIKRVKDLPFIPLSSVVGLRIKSLYNTYGRTILDVYCQSDGDKITAVMAVLGSGCTLAAERDADFGELDSFLQFLGAEVFCDAWMAERFEFCSCETVNLLQWRGETVGAVNEQVVKISEIYNLIKNGEDGDIELPCFDEWYADFCLRLNHGNAEYFSCGQAVAVAGFVTDGEALITGVAVELRHRGKGLGRIAVEGLVSKLKAKDPDITVYVCATDKTVEFYEKIGFKFAGQVVVLRY